MAETIILIFQTTIFRCFKNYGNPSHITRLKVAPNMADPTSMKHSVSSLKDSATCIIPWHPCKLIIACIERHWPCWHISQFFTLAGIQSTRVRAILLCSRSGDGSIIRCRILIAFKQCYAFIISCNRNLQIINSLASKHLFQAQKKSSKLASTQSKIVNHFLFKKTKFCIRTSTILLKFKNFTSMYALQSQRQQFVVT